jgi:hypothetical protein
VQYKSRVRLRVKQDGKRVCVQIDCLFLMPVFEYGSDFEIKISGVGDNADIRRKRGLFVSHCETGCSGGGRSVEEE